MMNLRYEAFLARIEVLRGNTGDPEDDGSSWRVTIEDVDSTLILLTGFLRTHSRDGVGRALVHGAMVPGGEEEAFLDVAEIKDSMTANACVEAMYDTARRSLNMQAAMMDFSFELSVRAPDVEIKTKRRRREAEMQDL